MHVSLANCGCSLESYPVAEKMFLMEQYAMYDGIRAALLACGAQTLAFTCCWFSTTKKVEQGRLRVQKVTLTVLRDSVVDFGRYRLLVMQGLNSRGCCSVRNR